MWGVARAAIRCMAANMAGRSMPRPGGNRPMAGAESGSGGSGSRKAGRTDICSTEWLLSRPGWSRRGDVSDSSCPMKSSRCAPAHPSPPLGVKYEMRALGNR
jgi:hypothetical protein